jgi:predicted nucleotidyltransferase
MDEKKNTLGSHLSSSPNYTPAPVAEMTVDAKEGEIIIKELEELKKKIIKKFPFTLSFIALPHQAFKFFEEDEGLTPEEVANKPIHTLLVVPEDEYKNIAKKIKPEIIKLVKECKQPVWVHIKTPVDIWNYGLDSKFDMIDALGAGLPLHDKGLLGALRVANIHKTLVLRKFEKYVATYAVGGSLVRGTADKSSDVDTFVIIDDTDVKKMPRLQLKEKLRAWINDYIREATMRAGVTNILNVQVYLLTEFWESVKDANPVIFTFIRDGVPMYDRGTFLPWKLLLRMGKIKPSPEAVDNFMKYGEQNDSLVKRRMMDAMIDIYWGVITPMQALMMLAGHAPPVPKTIVEDVKKEFVQGQKIMGMKELKTLERAVKLYKDYEHGKLKEISGAEVDSLLKDANDYDKKLKVLRKKLEDRIMLKAADSIYQELTDLLKNNLNESSESKLAMRFVSDFVKKSLVGIEK